MSLRLGFNEGEIRSDLKDWAQFYLVRPGEKELYLGADSKTIIINRLLKCLEPDTTRKLSGKVNGKDVYWVTTLSETHHSIYACMEDDKLYIFVQRDDTSLVSEIVLSEEQCANWHQSLLNV